MYSNEVLVGRVMLQLLAMCSHDNLVEGSHSFEVPAGDTEGMLHYVWLQDTHESHPTMHSLGQDGGDDDVPAKVDAYLLLCFHSDSHTTENIRFLCILLNRKITHTLCITNFEKNSYFVLSLLLFIMARNWKWNVRGIMCSQTIIQSASFQNVVKRL